MKKFTNATPLSIVMLLVFTTMLFFSSCSSNKQYFAFSPAPPAYVKKAPPKTVTTPAETLNTETAKTALTASAAPEQRVVLPEVAALQAETQATLATSGNASKTSATAAGVKPIQKLTLAQKVVMHKVQKQVKKLGNQTKAAAGPVSNRNAIALVLIGVVLAVFATLIGGGLGNLFYTLGILLLLVGLVLLILNYV